jgi:hypothetical protein
MPSSRFRSLLYHPVTRVSPQTLPDWIIAVSASEATAGALRPETTSAARSALAEHGVALLRGVLPAGVVDQVRQEFISQFGTLDPRAMAEQAGGPAPNPVAKVGDARYEITPRVSGAFADPAVFANPVVRGFLTPLLGEDMRLSGMTVVVSFPGAAMQHVHRDHSHLFDEEHVSAALPVYAVSVAVPLVDADLAAGPTGIWPGSHRWPEMRIPSPESATKISFQRGDFVLLDYRTLHAGLPNRSANARPVMYLAYARTWFFDEVNHEGRASLNMSLETYQSLPESVRPLVLRAYSHAMRARHVK